MADTFQTYFNKFDKAVVALSGGADSACTLMLAVEHMGKENVKAATCVNDHFFKIELDQAVRIAQMLGVEHIPFTADISPEFYKGGEMRCYHCKKSIMSAIIAQNAADIIFDGTNADDDLAERKGSIAAGELGIVSPLHDLGLGKAFVHEKVKALGLIFRDESCKATRINGIITDEKMAQVDAFESPIKEQFPGLRYRIDENRVEFKKPLRLSSEDFQIISKQKK
ncbi:MAG: 7-cyano-7-deazaguanine synthase [Deferribacterales bacterium]